MLKLKDRVLWKYMLKFAASNKFEKQMEKGNNKYRGADSFFGHEPI